MRKPWDCPRCGKVFASKRGARDHISSVHTDAESTVGPRRRPRPPKADHDPSLADIAVEAQLKCNMGEPLDSLEESLIFD